jgi:predicted tellurium resistance membrane protein TerC
VLDVYLVFLGPWEFPDALQTSAVLTGLAVGSLLIEAYLAVGFWLRGNWRWLALALGVAFHLTIVATMRARWGLTVFSLEMFALYALFFSWRRRAR